MSDHNDLLREFAKRCKERIKEFEKTEVKCGLIGPSGSGKSSLINAIAGEQIAKVGVVETTDEPQPFTHKGITFTDLPGCGTKKWPKASYIKRLKLESYDCFLLITADRFTENDCYLFTALRELGKPCFVIRNKIDQSIDAGFRDSKHSEAETKKIIKRDIERNLAPAKPEKIYLTSAWHPAKHDLESLLEDIADALEGLKKARFVADMAAYGKKALKKKREVALEQLPLYAGLAAANGLNPVPGVDIATDIGILLKLGRSIAHIYGLTAKQIEYIERFIGPEIIPLIVAKVAQFTAKYLAKQGIAAALRKIATRVTAKQVAKWVPFVGPLVSAGIGWKSTFMFGQQMIDEAEALADEILKDVLKRSQTASA